MLCLLLDDRLLRLLGLLGSCGLLKFLDLFLLLVQLLHELILLLCLKSIDCFLRRLFAVELGRPSCRLDLGFRFHFRGVYLCSGQVR